LQRIVLTPLELELAARLEVQSWRPAQLVRTVLTALDECRFTRRLS
jgi:hypothetical protein